MNGASSARGTISPTPNHAFFFVVVVPAAVSPTYSTDTLQTSPCVLLTPWTATGSHEAALIISIWQMHGENWKERKKAGA